MRYTLMCVLAGLTGLIAGAYACLGVILAVAPSMGYEDTLWYIFPSAIAGVLLAVLNVRKFKRRLACRAP